jgi:hypothetical protein
VAEDAVISVQDPPTQQSPAAQTCPHAPQFSASVFTLTQVFEQRVPSQDLHTPFMQDWLDAQTLPQAPQLNGSVTRSAHCCAHCAWLVGHPTHAPLLQT